MLGGTVATSTQVFATRRKGKNTCSFEFLSYLLVYCLAVYEDNFITIGHSGVEYDVGGEWKRCTYHDCNKSSSKHLQLSNNVTWSVSLRVRVKVYNLNTIGVFWTRIPSHNRYISCSVSMRDQVTRVIMSLHAHSWTTCPLVCLHVVEVGPITEFGRTYLWNVRGS